jgi:hypothetical protein
MISGFNRDADGLWIAKDPDADLDYSVVWADWLQDAEVIASVAWTVPSGLVGHDPLVNAAPVTIDGRQHRLGTVPSIFISGGSAGTTYTVGCRITTNATPPRTDERSFRLVVRQR